MEKRFVAFLVIALAIVMANSIVMNWLNPPQPKPVAQRPAEDAKAAPGGQEIGAAADAEQPAVAQPAGDSAVSSEDDENAGEQPAEPANPAAAEETIAIPETRVTLGSADPESRYKMLVTLVNRGAAVERVELNSATDVDEEDRGGYIGHLDAVDSEEPSGARLVVVGPGTPAAKAGLQSDDVITAVGDSPIALAHDLERVIAKTRPGDELEISFSRGGAKQSTKVALTRPLMEVIRPDDIEQVIKYWERVGPHLLMPRPTDRPSFLMTLEQIDDRKLGDRPGELASVDLEQGNWEIMPGATAERVEFRKALPRVGLEVVKRYELAQLDPNQQDKPAYNLNLSIEIRNTGAAVRKVGYRLYGPNGLPTEGWWYASKISRNWGGAGPRDVVLGAQDGDRIAPAMISTSKIVSENGGEPRRGMQLAYIGVDAQYFSVVVLPQRAKGAEDWLYEWQPVVVGPVPKESDKQRLTNVSFRLSSAVAEIAPGEEGVIKHAYTVFAGAKKPELVAKYGLGDLVYYGWFGQVARPMAGLLHAFYAVVRNYGIAIILLTVLVRSCMMPLSRKQTLAAQKMQELQPELKKLQEKYKNNMEARSKAQQELFRKHNYNPMGGCLLMFVQLPIFIGLYRALSVDIELRGAPLLWPGAWCANLAAPDMLYRWVEWLPGFLLGWLGPYFNLLPVITIVLFIFQQKMFMPPATDEQTAMQQKMMQYMMIFIGVMFFKVPSGLCIYFIASSLWGLAERKILPKPTLNKDEPPTQGKAAARLPVSPNGNGNGQRAGDKKKQREKH